MAMAQLILLPFFFIWRQFAVFSKDPNKGPSENEKKMQEKAREQAEKVEILFQ